jgi:hypothetical protein
VGFTSVRAGGVICLPFRVGVLLSTILRTQSGVMKVSCVPQLGGAVPNLSQYAVLSLGRMQRSARICLLV